jgi:hypothetical protein
MTIAQEFPTGVIPTFQNSGPYNTLDAARTVADEMAGKSSDGHGAVVLRENRGRYFVAPIAPGLTRGPNSATLNDVGPSVEAARKSIRATYGARTEEVETHLQVGGNVLRFEAPPSRQ